jgi:hypothetical protein
MSGYALGPAELRPPAITRRRLVTAAAVVGAGAVAVSVPTVRAALAGTAYSGSGALRSSTFLPLVGSTVTFTVGDAEGLGLRLVAVEGVGTAAVTEDVFTLRLRGPAAVRQGGEVGTLSSPSLRPTALLVVPSGRPVDGAQDWVATIVGGRHG